MHGRTPLDEWSARRRDLYLTTLNNRQTSMPPRSSNPRSLQADGCRPHSLNHAAGGISISCAWWHSVLPPLCFLRRTLKGNISLYCLSPRVLRLPWCHAALPRLVVVERKPHSSMSPVLWLCTLTTHRHSLHASGRYNYHVCNVECTTSLKLYSNYCRVSYTYCKVFTPVVIVQLHCLYVKVGTRYKPEGRGFDSRWCQHFFIDMIFPVAPWPWGRLNL
jgi:hypothetical protein